MRARIGAAVVAAAVVVGGATVAAGQTQQGAVTAGGARLDKDDRALVAEALANKRPVTVLLLAEVGANAKVADRVRGLGATVRNRNDDVGYLRVTVDPKRAAAVAGAAGIVAAAVDRPFIDRNPELPQRPGGAAVPAAAAPGPGTPAVNPYLPAGDIGAPQFIQAHPTWDGRGITIGIVDDGIDVLTPELQRARLKDGTVVPKIADFVTTDEAGDPFRPDPTWVDMATQATATGGTVTIAGQPYTVPANGTYRVGVFDERQDAFGPIEQDVNRDHNPPGSSGTFAVLWDAARNTVWVDTDQDHSFADERAMTDYRLHNDVGVFGTDNPGTPVRDTVPFVIQTDPTRKLVDINFEMGDHGTAVASVAAGEGFFGGAISGSAPAARLAVVRSNFMLSSILEGITYLAQKARADVITLSFGPVSPPSFNTTRTIYTEVVDRLMQSWDVQVVAAAGNSGPDLESVASPSTTQRVISVGASATPASWDVLFGLPVAGEGVTTFSARGPADDGAFKPDVVAPGISLVAVPAWEEAFPGPDPGYALPPGYANYAGTSFSSPLAAGGVALLLSAASQTGVQARTDQLRPAIFSGARRLDGFGWEAQGRGVFDVGGAWQVLSQKMATTQIDVSAPVRTVNSARLPVPNTGFGLYEREGWSPGQTGSRTVTLTRQSGPTRPITAALSWTGNDGTFTAPAQVALPRRAGAAVPVGIAPPGPGLHSAILNVDDPSTPGVDLQVPVAIVAAASLNDSNHFRMTFSGTVPASGVVQEFVRLPPADILALRTRSLGGFLLVVPASSSGLQSAPAEFIGPGDATDVPWPSTRDGVWELDLLPFTPWSIEVTIVGGVAVTPTPVVVDPASVGTTYPRPLNFAAEGIGLTGQAVATDLGPLHAETLTLNEGEPAFFEVDVADGSTSLGVRIDHASDPGADVDLYLFDCTFGFCFQVGQGVSDTAREQIVLTAPAPGPYFVVVDPFLVPSGTTALSYADVVAAPSWGTIAVADAVTYHGPTDAWSRTAAITPQAAPGPLGGFIGVEADGIDLWGGAQVEVRSIG